MTPFDNDIDQLLTQAEALLQAEKPIEALDLLERARKLQPQHAWAKLFRGVALGQLGRVEEAVSELIAAADENLSDIDIQVDTARYLSLMEYQQDALICTRRAVAIDATDAGAQAMQAEVLERLGRLDEAVIARESALTLDAEDHDNRYYYAVDLCDLGRYQPALDIAEGLLASHPDDPDIVRLYGACLSYQGRHEEALGCWAMLERLEEGVTPNLLHNRASTLDVLGRYQEALETIDQAISEEPEVGGNYFTRGMIHEHHDEQATAIEDYLTALLYDPDHIDAVINLVEIASITGTAPLVFDRVNTLLETEPTSSKLLYARGRLAIELGDFTQAERAIKEALRCEPSLGVAWYTLSMLYGMMEQSEKSVACADRALREFPDDANLWLYRGQALHDLKRFPEAAESYDRAIALSPEDGQTWFHLGRLLLLDLERPADARGMLKEALRLQPDNDGAAWMLALCHLRMGQAIDAETLINPLLAEDPQHLWGRLVNAAILTQRGDLQAAVADLEIAVSQKYNPRLLLNEPLFSPLWGDPRFSSLLRRYSTT
ncbi:MAG TPA: tetratricopeptide repeat protein [Armatimonadota bacterium]